MNYYKLLEDYINKDYPNSKTVQSFEDKWNIIIIWHSQNSDHSYTDTTEVTALDLLTFIYTK